MADGSSPFKLVRARSSEWCWKTSCSASVRSDGLSRHYTNPSSACHGLEYRWSVTSPFENQDEVVVLPEKMVSPITKADIKGPFPFVFLITRRVLSTGFRVHCNRHADYVLSKDHGSPTCPEIHNWYPG